MEIPLSNGGVAIIDACDYCLVERYTWYRHDNCHVSYAMAAFRIGDRTKKISMHRTILALTDRSVQTDHWNHNGLDNRRINLRVATPTLNAANKRIGSRNKSGYKGVCCTARHINSTRPWLVVFKANGKRVFYGRFSSAVEAARAYDKLALLHYGRFACLNLPLYTPLSP